jgi:hypothetical protein
VPFNQTVLHTKGTQPRAEFSEAMRKRRISGESPTIQRAWGLENMSRSIIPPRKGRVSLNSM